MSPDIKAFVKLVPATTRNRDQIGPRSFHLVPDEDAVEVGRSSANIQKKLIAAEDNAWMDSPVISREHARIWASTTRAEMLYISDLRSMHGTFINNKRLASSVPHALRNGDVVTFGSQVIRDKSEYRPRSYLIECKWEEIGRATTPSRTYSVPETSDDSDDGDLDEIQEEAVKDRQKTVSTDPQLAMESGSTKPAVPLDGPTIQGGPSEVPAVAFDEGMTIPDSQQSSRAGSACDTDFEGFGERRSYHVTDEYESDGDDGSSSGSDPLTTIFASFNGEYGAPPNHPGQPSSHDAVGSHDNPVSVDDSDEEVRKVLDSLDEPPNPDQGPDISASRCDEAVPSDTEQNPINADPCLEKLSTTLGPANGDDHVSSGTDDSESAGDHDICEELCAKSVIPETLIERSLEAITGESGYPTPHLVDSEIDAAEDELSFDDDYSDEQSLIDDDDDDDDGSSSEGLFCRDSDLDIQIVSKTDATFEQIVNQHDSMTTPTSIIQGGEPRTHDHSPEVRSLGTRPIPEQIPYPDLLRSPLSSVPDERPAPFSFGAPMVPRPTMNFQTLGLPRAQLPFVNGLEIQTSHHDVGFDFLQGRSIGRTDNCGLSQVTKSAESFDHDPIAPSESVSNEQENASKGDDDASSSGGALHEAVDADASRSVISEHRPSSPAYLATWEEDNEPHWECDGSELGSSGCMISALRGARRSEKESTELQDVHPDPPTKNLESKRASATQGVKRKAEDEDQPLADSGSDPTGPANHSLSTDGELPDAQPVEPIPRCSQNSTVDVLEAQSEVVTSCSASDVQPARKRAKTSQGPLDKSSRAKGAAKVFGGAVVAGVGMFLALAAACPDPIV